jgi:ABC-type glycerol-3-phosphate transport system permease component
LLLIAVPILVISGVVMAVLLYEQVAGWRFHRTVLFAPYIIAIPVIGIVFSNMLSLNGAINQLLRGIGLGRLALDWLGSGLLALVTSLMVVPPVVMIIPLFLFFSRLKLTSTYTSATLVYAGLITLFAVFLLTSFFLTIPHEIVESDLIDGASSLGILVRIILPLSTPALITLVVVNALWVWNDLLIALVLLPNDQMRTLIVGITVFGSRFNADVPVSLAGMLLASIPMLALYMAGQRYFTRGLVAGALKG